MQIITSSFGFADLPQGRYAPRVKIGEFIVERQRGPISHSPPPVFDSIVIDQIQGVGGSLLLSDISRGDAERTAVTRVLFPHLSHIVDLTVFCEERANLEVTLLSARRMSTLSINVEVIPSNHPQIIRSSLDAPLSGVEIRVLYQNHNNEFPHVFLTAVACESGSSTTVVCESSKLKP